MGDKDLTKKEKEMLQKIKEKNIDQKTNEGYRKHYEDEKKRNKSDREKMLKMIRKLLGK